MYNEMSIHSGSLCWQYLSVSYWFPTSLKEYNFAIYNVQYVHFNNHVYFYLYAQSDISKNYIQMAVSLIFYE